MGYDDFDEFYEKVIIESYRKSVLKGKKYDEDDSNEKPTAPSSDTETTTQPITSKIFEEDLVNVA